MGMEWPPAPSPAQLMLRKAVVGGKVTLKSLLLALVAGLALWLLLAGPSVRLFPPTASPEAAALVTAAPAARDVNAGRGMAPAPIAIDDTIVSTKDSGPQTTLDKKQVSKEESCNLFHGEWIPHSAGPAYTNASCHFIESPQNCMTNGRPDNSYLYWRWKPYGCDLPPFDSRRFLNSMQGRHWALIGDSILRNHIQSLLCLLSKVEDPIQVYHDETFRSRRWHFPLHNFTVSLVWAPFLVKAEISEDENGVSSSEPQLHLDVLEPNWTGQWESFDYVVISTGQWFFKTAIYLENKTVIGCHSCQNKNLRETTFEYSFRKSLREVFQFITSVPHKPVVFYRTWTPSHFENGEWSSGGTCNRTLPFKPGEAGDRKQDNNMWNIEREEFNKAVGKNHTGRLKLLDTFKLSLLRPDGHPGPYRTYHPYEKTTVKIQNDCLHWCLPGPIDAWNDIIMQMLPED